MALSYWALICLVVAVIAGLLRFTGLAPSAGGITRLVFRLFAGAFLVLLVLSLFTDRSWTPVSYGM